MSGVFSGTADFGGTSLTSSAAVDAFIAKYDDTGNMLWVRQIGGAENDYITHLALDASGNLGVAGNLGGNAEIGGFPVSGNRYIAKYDAAGNAYVTGQFQDSVSFGTITLKTTSDPGQVLNDVFTAKYDDSRRTLWAQQGKVTDGGVGATAHHISVDAAGDVYIAGTYDFDIQFGEVALPVGDLINAFLTKYDDSGNLQWAQLVESSEYSLELVDLILRGDDSYLAYNYRGSLGSPSNLHLKIVKYDASGSAGLTIEERSEETAKYEDALPARYVFVDADGRIYVTFSFVGTAQISDFTLTSDDFSNLFTAIYDA